MGHVYSLGQGLTPRQPLPLIRRDPVGDLGKTQRLPYPSTPAVHQRTAVSYDTAACFSPAFVLEYRNLRTRPRSLTGSYRFIGSNHRGTHASHGLRSTRSSTLDFTPNVCLGSEYLLKLQQTRPQHTDPHLGRIRRSGRCVSLSTFAFELLTLP